MQYLSFCLPLPANSSFYIYIAYSGKGVLHMNCSSFLIFQISHGSAWESFWELTKSKVKYQ